LMSSRLFGASDAIQPQEAANSIHDKLTEMHKATRAVAA